MIEWLIIGAAALMATAAATLSSEVRLAGAAWLRRHNLAASALMDAWVLLDNVAGAVRARLRLTTHRHGTQEVVLDRSYRLDQVDDPQVRALLAKRSQARVHVLDHFS